MLFLSFPSSAIRHTVSPVSTYATMVKKGLMVVAMRMCNPQGWQGRAAAAAGLMKGVKVAGGDHLEMTPLWRINQFNPVTLLQDR